MTDSPSQTAESYQVLARKYRPVDFNGLIGQDALVQTLTNALQSGRVAHAFMLTGVRGVGKTTTARIIARMLNCLDLKDGVHPCGVCTQCVSISENRHVDVIEMDAASHTGVDDMRSLIEGVGYVPVSGRYKVYIIDEVHMLSKAAFNALLKTLEEPPKQVVFIFATTEIRKVPITVLSRCQRFDLRRVDIDTLIAHFQKICDKEQISADENALSLIARAADGSVRDGLSLLDQGTALGQGKVEKQTVQNMLGLADRSVVIDLMETVLQGEAKQSLDCLEKLYQAGADPLVVLQDLLEFVHFLTRVKSVPETAGEMFGGERGVELANRVSMPVLTRTWQILLKGLNELQQAPIPLQALEIILLRLIYASGLPSPEEMLKKTTSSVQERPPVVPVSQTMPDSTATNLALHVQPQETRLLDSFSEMVALFSEKKEVLLYGFLYNAVHVVKFSPGRLEMRLQAGVPSDFTSDVMRCLQQWTGQRWMISLSEEAGEETLITQDRTKEKKMRQDVENHGSVQKILTAFPGTKIRKISNLKGAM